MQLVLAFVATDMKQAAHRTWESDQDLLAIAAAFADAAHGPLRMRPCDVDVANRGLVLADPDLLLRTIQSHYISFW
jgi:hypothetical protein